MSILAAGEVSVKEAANILEHANQLRRKRSRSRYVHVPKGKRYRRQYGMTEDGVLKLIARGDIVPLRREGLRYILSRDAVLELARQRLDAARLRLDACKATIAELLQNGPRDRRDIFKALAGRFGRDVVYAAMRVLKIKAARVGAKGVWALPGQRVEPNRNARMEEPGAVFIDALGRRWLTEGQLQIVHGATPTLAKQWAKRKSKRRGGYALRKKMVPRPAHYPPGPKKVPGYLESDWLDIAAGKEYRRMPGEGPGPVHARLYTDRLDRAKQALLRVIPQGSPALQVETVRATLAGKGVDWRAAKTAFASLGGTKTSTTEKWSASNAIGRKQWWWSLPASAYVAGAPMTPPVPAARLGSDGAALGDRAPAGAAATPPTDGSHARPAREIHEEWSRRPKAPTAAVDTTAAAAAAAAAQPAMPFVPTAFQQRILDALRHKALAVRDLARQLKIDNGTLYARGLTPLKKAGRIGMHRTIGYFRWDALPPKYAEFLEHHPKVQNNQNKVPAVIP